MKNTTLLLLAGSLIPSALLAQTSSGPDVAVLGADSFQHGELVTTQFQNSFGITVSAIRYNPTGEGTFTPEAGEVVAFDTNIFGTTGVESSDPDLQFSTNLEIGDGPRTQWAGGNLPLDTDLGTVLIIQENDNVDANGIYTDPDDNVIGGEYIFTIDDGFDYRAINIVTADLDEGTEDRYRLRFTGEGSNGAILSQERNLAVLLTENSVAFDGGNGHINDFGTFRLESFDQLVAGGVDRFTEVRFIVENESGGAGLFTFAVPEPSTALLSLVGLAGLLRRRR